jgi:predicted nucleotidyltransferase
MLSKKAKGLMDMQRNDVIKRLRKHRTELVEMGVRSLALFGSLARGEEDAASDVDLLVELDPERPLGLFEYVAIQQRIEEILEGTPVDLVMRGALHEELRENILKEAIPIG